MTVGDDITSVPAIVRTLSTAFGLRTNMLLRPDVLSEHTAVRLNVSQSGLAERKAVSKAS